MGEGREERTLQLLFDVTPEIYATDSAGGFVLPLVVSGDGCIETEPFDEVRFVFSVWHPSRQQGDRPRPRLRRAPGARSIPKRTTGRSSPRSSRWCAPYGAGETFDGWIVLPVLGARTAYALVGSGFEPRTRLQVRASAYFVA